MFNKVLSMSIVVLLLNLMTISSVWASGNAEKEIRFTEKVKTNIAKLGTGTDAEIKVKLKDGTTIKGYVKEAGNDEFVVLTSKTNQAVSIPHSNVKQVKGNNLNSGTKILIGVGIFLLVVIIAGIASK